MLRVLLLRADERPNLVGLDWLTPQVPQPGLRRELEQKNPAGPNGRRKAKHFQRLTEEVGNPRLLHHLGLLEGIGKAFDDGDWDDYRAAVNRRLPKPTNTLPLFSEQEDDEQ